MSDQTAQQRPFTGNANVPLSRDASFQQSGVPVYKSDWTDSRSIAYALEYFTDATERQQAGERLATFHVERLDFRTRDPEAFYKGLERNGPKAVREFREAIGW